MERLIEIRQSMALFFDCGYEYFAEYTSPDIVLNRLLYCMRDGKQQGYTPIIVVPDEPLLETFKDNCKDENDKFNIFSLRKFRTAMLHAELMDGKAILEKRLDSLNEQLVESGVNIKKVVGDFEEAYEGPSNDIYALEDISFNGVFIVKVPVRYPWQIFAYLPMGDWGICPSNTELMSISKYMYERYQAVPVAMTSNELEFKVLKPITSEHEAMGAAFEHCPLYPRMFEDFGTIGSYAGTLINSSIWYFVWPYLTEHKPKNKAPAIKQTSQRHKEFAYTTKQLQRLYGQNN